VPSWGEDKDFVIFGLVASETDHLPLGESRQYWDPQALKRADAELNGISEFYRVQIVEACTNVLARFSRGN
jgi:hypothetical protein